MSGERGIGYVKSIVDLAYTSLAVAVLLYTVRGEIRRIVDEKRAEIAEHRAALIARDHETQSRFGFLWAIRDRVVLGERVADEHLAEALDAFNAETEIIECPT